MKKSEKWVIALAIIAVIVAANVGGVAHYDATHPTSLPQTEGFKLVATQPNQASFVLNIPGCNITTPPPKVEDYINGIPVTIDVVVLNTGTSPLYISTLTMNSNLVGSWVVDVPQTYGSTAAAISTGNSQVYGFYESTANWPTGPIINLHFTATASDGMTNSTNLSLKSFFSPGNSTSTTMSTSSTATSTGSTVTCPITVAG